MISCQPKHLLGQPEYYLFVLLHKAFTGSKFPKHISCNCESKSTDHSIPKNVTFIFVNNITGALQGVTSDRLSAHGSKAEHGDAKPRKAIKDKILGAARVTKGVLKPVIVLAVRTVLVSWALFFNDAVLALQYSFKR